MLCLDIRDGPKTGNGPMLGSCLGIRDAPKTGMDLALGARLDYALSTYHRCIDRFARLSLSEILGRTIVAVISSWATRLLRIFYDYSDILLWHVAS